MMEQIISYETAVLAKEKGFDWECNDAYVDYRPYEDWYEQLVNYQTAQNHNTKEHRESAPTQNLLQKWLREVHEIDIEVIVYTKPHYCVSLVDKYGSVQHIDNHKPFFEEHPRAFETYEEALEVGLYQALKLIKNDSNTVYR